jgi:gliding motility-associated lipoprotein GldD
MRIVVLFMSFLVLLSCGEDVLVKPKAKLRLDYPASSFHQANTNCDYNFMVSDYALIEENKNCGTSVHYPNMNATVFVTYQKVQDDNLEALIYDAQKLAYNHNSRADGIPEQIFVNSENSVYGMFYSINGNAASQSHFYVTDSLQHFVTGSLYFEVKPNFDSIYPAVVYIRGDIRKMMETIQWE